jgi:hypothetical protein
VPLAREHHPRILVGGGHGDVGIGLVVAQPDVERRPVALDQVLLQQQRLVFAAGPQELDLLDPVDQLRGLERGVRLAPEVRLHPLSQ